MPYADVSQYVLASEAIPEIARCYFGGDTRKAEFDVRIAAQEGALHVFLGGPVLQYIRRDRWYHDPIHWSSIYEPLYFPRADLLKFYPDLWRSLQSPGNETTPIAVPEGAPDSDTAQSDAIDVDTSGSDQTAAEIDVTQGAAREAEQDAKQKATATSSDETSRVNIYSTGLPGRPSIRHLILEEFERRVTDNKFEPKLGKEATALHKWAKSAHPTAPATTAGTIENLIRSRHREAQSSDELTKKQKPQN